MSHNAVKIARLVKVERFFYFDFLTVEMKKLPIKYMSNCVDWTINEKNLILYLKKSKKVLTRLKYCCKINLAIRGIINFISGGNL